MVVGAKEVRVVVTHKWHVELFGKTSEVRVDCHLHLHVMHLEFNKEAGFTVLVWAERLCMPTRFIASAFKVRFIASLFELHKVPSER
jgi:hypothetical protein